MNGISTRQASFMLRLPIAVRSSEEICTAAEREVNEYLQPGEWLGELVSVPPGTPTGDGQTERPVTFIAARHET
jgi:hypothetical protein